MATTTANDVLLFIPNLIGYARVLAALSSFFIIVLSPENYVIAVSLYMLNFVGDLFDGWAARKLHQTSSFGSVLDMVTDRCGTAGFLFVLAGEYHAVPIARLAFVSLMILDISSHWVQMHSSLALGEHHKSAEGNKDKNFLVRWFYQYYWFFGYLCVGAEFTYILLYLRIHVTQDILQWFVHVALMICLPGCAAKQIVNIAQLSSSCYAIAAHDAKAKAK